MAGAARFGSIVIQAGTRGAFEVIRRLSPKAGTLIASFEIELAHMPKLKLRRMRAQKRAVARSMARTGDRVLLARIEGCELTAQGADDDVEIILTGDWGHRLVHWRAEFTVIDGEVVVHGPFLSGDLHS